MATLAVADFVFYCDKLAAAWLAALGTSGSGLGMGDNTILVDASAYGTDRKLRDIVNHIEALADYGQIHALLEGAHNAQSNASAQSVMPGIVANLFGSLTSDCSAAGLAGVNSIDSFATYYNTGAGGPSNALFAPEFSDLYLLVRGVRPSLANIYSPAIASMATKVVGGAFTHVADADITKCGGVAVVRLTTTSFAGSSDTVTVTGTNQAGQTGRTWTGTVAANGNVTATPTVASDLLVSVQSITIGANITASTQVQVVGLVPAGRTAPPA